MESIWFNKDIRLADFSHWSHNTLSDHLGMAFTAVDARSLTATMPVDERTRQPFGLLHGGASVALAETLGSVGSALVVNPDTHFCLGIEINANHIRGVKSGIVRGVATPIHLGRSTHIWEIRISNDADQLVCISRLTVSILEKMSKH